MTPTNSPEHTLTIDGARIDGIAGFYAEINRVFMAQEEWQLGASLDALEAGHGPTYFEQICQVIASHPRFTLELV